MFEYMYCSGSIGINVSSPELGSEGVGSSISSAKTGVFAGKYVDRSFLRIGSFTSPNPAKDGVKLDGGASIIAANL